MSLTCEEQMAIMRHVEEDVKLGRRCQSCLRWRDRPTLDVDCDACRAEDAEWLSPLPDMRGDLT